MRAFSRKQTEKRLLSLRAQAAILLFVIAGIVSKFHKLFHTPDRPSMRILLLTIEFEVPPVAPNISSCLAGVLRDDNDLTHEHSVVQQPEDVSKALISIPFRHVFWLVAGKDYA